LGSSDCRNGACYDVVEHRSCQPDAVCGRPFLVADETRFAEFAGQDSAEEARLYLEHPPVTDPIVEDRWVTSESVRRSNARISRFLAGAVNATAPAAS
jgi:hypothetical protein